MTPESAELLDPIIPQGDPSPELSYAVRHSAQKGAALQAQTLALAGEVTRGGFD